ncbi:competence type IV pilus major pilin ComGC [Macrococcus equipercicus]|uniref:ComG operon protein 3 n=1 Tax=Macrococcus equipercicus TaxID=69967 RepID=A0A9Q9F0K3_9STAP|nr:competence type IV pilus major pilin ComGC [Macrococcus equipercicus]KAA1040111.1 prepilin-type N-terminal cleavage/methylation domain-containing protein [Macrococcus equipercicus]UTH12942.1 prepilin-type N-terminal cleavage/methylation domain-containing protein [Macrococcus equipercicus]
MLNFIRKGFKKVFRSDEGFTLIEMLLVLLVISVLIIVIIPNIAKQTDNVQQTGCQAQVKMVQGQIEAYRLQNGTTPASIQELVPEFLKSNQTTCKNGSQITIVNGEATAGK